MLSLSPSNCRWYNDVGEGMCGIKNTILERHLELLNFALSFVQIVY